MKRAFMFVALAALTASTLLAAAQPAPKKPPPAPAHAEGGAAHHALAAKEGAQPALKDAGAPKGGAVVEQKTASGDAGSRVFRFGEVEVEGRLKSPQIVYFLRRVRAEFAAGDLGHRSFMREMGDTKNEPSF